MAISYNKLWKMLIDKNMTKTQLRKSAGLTTNVIAKMGKGQSVQIESLYKICEVLGCGLDDISEVIPEQENASEEKDNG